jgi:NADH-quinone oxidoreductase subunit A
MPAIPDTASDYIPILIQIIVVGGFVATNMVLTHLIGPKLKGRKKEEQFEAGYRSKGDAHIPFSIKFFMVAILFVLFDVEVIFLYPWAVSFTEMMRTELANTWFIEMFLFIAFLLVGFIYILRQGVLQWGKADT